MKDGDELGLDLDGSEDCWICAEPATGVLPLRLTLKPTVEQITAWLCEQCCLDAEADPEVRAQLELQAMMFKKAIDRVGDLPPDADES